MTMPNGSWTPDPPSRHSGAVTNDAMQAFHDHVAALEARDLDAVVAGYSPDAVLVDTDRIGRGHDHIRSVFAQVLDAAADLQPETTVLADEGVVYVSFRASRPGLPDLVGTDTFVVEDGLIMVHTGYNTAAGGDGEPAPLGVEPRRA